MGTYGQIGTPDNGDPPTCRVFNSGNISVNNNAVTALTFDSERFDTDSMHSVATNTSRITINTAGVYLITGHVIWGADTDYTRRFIDFFVSNATIIARQEMDFTTPAINASGEAWSLASIYKFAVNDYVEFRAFQQNTSAGANNILATGNLSPEFAACWISSGA